MNSIEIKIKTAQKEDILNHLCQCNTDFTPHLEKSVNLTEFSTKIYAQAITFEAWIDHNIISLVSGYVNDSANKVAFINHVSVLKEFRGNGLAKTLLEAFTNYAENENFKSIRLEVSENNRIAIKLYEKCHFTIKDKVDTKIIMVKNLSGESL